MPKSSRAIELIYQRIGNGKDLTYGSYLGWITLALAKRFRWYFMYYINSALYYWKYALILLNWIITFKNNKNTIIKLDISITECQ